MSNALRGMISQRQLLAIFFVSRLVVSLTNIQAVSIGKFSSDILISFSLSFLLTCLLSLPVVLCLNAKKSPLDSRVLSVAYLVYYVLFASLSVSRFAYFVATGITRDSPMFVFIILAFIAVGYGAYLGIEALGRFAVPCAVTILFVIAVIVAFNFKSFDCVNLFPAFENDSRHIIANTVIFTSNTIEPALLPVLARRTNGSPVKPYYAGIGCAYLSVFVLLLMCVGVFGNSADLQAFPIYSLFQCASINDMSRLDILHLAFWVLAVFIKCAVLIYCSSVVLKKFTHKSKVIGLCFVGFALSFALNELIGMYFAYYSKPLLIALFLIFVVIVPLVNLLLGRKRIE